MSVELTPNEADGFNFYWKIKNFSYSTESIYSPEFTYDGDLCSLVIHQREFTQCQLIILTDANKMSRIKYVLSFLTCDGSSPLTTDTSCLQASKETLFRTRRSSFLPDDTLTVHFQFSADSEKGRLLVQSLVGVKRKCFLWTMTNFFEDQHHRSDFKLIVENTNQFGIVEMRLKSTDGFNSDEQLFIEVTFKTGEGCYCALEVSVLDADGKAVNCVNGEFLTDNVHTEQKWNFPPFVKKSKLLANKDRIVPDGTLSLKCNFAISMGTITDETTVLSYCDDVTPLLKESEALSKCFKDKSSSDSIADLKIDLKKSLDNETFSDVILQVGSKVIHANMAILGARSPVFESMFMEDRDENAYNVIVIKDLDVDTVNRLLLYMYTDTIHDSNWKNIKKLYSAAQEYEVQSLKQKCSSLLKSKFSILNICEILSLADSYKDTDLKAAVLDYISKHDSEVFASKKWKDLEKNNYSLAIQALREICLQKRLD